VVYAEATYLAAHVSPERIVAGARDHRGAPTVPGRGHGPVRRAAAEEPAERRSVLETDADLQGIQVDAYPAHRDHVERHARTSSTRTGRCSARDSSQASAIRKASSASATVHVGS